MSETRFRLDLNLEKLAMISLSTKLWYAPDAKTKVRNYYESWNVEEKPSDDKWEEISKFVVHYADLLELPSTVIVELKKIIRIVGEKIQSWIFYAEHVLMLPVDFAEEIYSTYGRAIDETKISNLYCIEKAQNFMTYSSYSQQSPAYSLACIYGCEKFINEHKIEMIGTLSLFYPQVRIGDEIYNIMSVLICLIAKESIKEFVPHPRKMFELCLKEGFSEAARFYWERLDEIERVSNLIYFAEKCFEEKDNILLREGYPKILIFLINQMEEEEKCLFFKYYADKIILAFLPVWPYEKFIVHLLRYDWDIESGRWLEMLNFITNFNVRCVGLECPVENGLFFQVFHKAWKNITVNERIVFFRDNEVKLSLCCNVPILNLIVNDSNIQLRNSPIDDELIVGLACLRLVKTGKFHLLDELIEKIFIFDSKPKEILKQHFVKISMDFIVQNEFILIDKFFNWLSESEEEKSRLKNEINPISMCRHLTEGRVYVKSYVHALNKYKETEKLTDFELAERFLKWRFETDAEIKNFKEGMKSYNFIMGGSSGDFRYIRIRSGDLSCLEPGDAIATRSNDIITGDNIDGFPFLKFGDTTVIDHSEVIMGGKYDDRGFIACRSPDLLKEVVFVGTKPGDFVLLNICEIWKNLIHHPDSPTNTTEMVVGLCNAFIKFYYETEEEVEQFKKTKLQVLDVDNVVEFLYNRLVIGNPIRGFNKTPRFRPGYRGISVFEILNEFFKFCLIPLDKVEEIKIQQRNDFENLMNNYLIYQFNVGLAQFCIGWLYDSFGNVTKEEKMKNFINSSNKGILVCVSYLKNRRGRDRTSASDLNEQLRMWMKLVNDKKKFRKDLCSWYPNVARLVLDLLDDRKQARYQPKKHRGARFSKGSFKWPLITWKIGKLHGPDKIYRGAQA